MNKLNEREIAQIYIGKKYNKERLASLCGYDDIQSDDSDFFPVHCEEFENEECEKFGITEVLFDNWDCNCITFHVEIYTDGKIISDGKIYKYKYTYLGHGRPRGYEVLPTQQEIRVFRRIMDYLTSDVQYDESDEEDSIAEETPIAEETSTIEGECTVCDTDDFVFEKDTAGSTLKKVNRIQSGNVIIPQYDSQGDPVVRIGDEAFRECEKLTGIVIPDSVTSIGSSAFMDCINLTSITIPNGITSIGENAFWGCANLASVTIPNSVTSIGDFAFYYCPSLTSIEIPDGVTSIGEKTVCLCDALTSITIPDSVISIGRRALCQCPNLTNITFKGTKKAWKAIEFGEDWKRKTPTINVICSDETLKVSK